VAERPAEVSGEAAAQSRADRPRSVAADIHATSARRFHPSAAQPIAAAVSRELPFTT